MKPVILAVANQKGGVGKTSLVANLAWVLSQGAGLRVLLADLDPQANLTAAFDHPAPSATLADWLVDPALPVASVRVEVADHLGLLPATEDLAGAEALLSRSDEPAVGLRACLAGLRRDDDEEADLDLILIDCPPSLGLLTVNGLAAADHVLTPVQCAYWSLQGLRQLMDSIERVRARGNPDLDLVGLVLNMYDSRTLHSAEVVEGLRERFGKLVFKATIPRTVRFDDATVMRQPLVAVAREHKAAVAIENVAGELLRRLKLKARRRFRPRRIE